MKARHRTVLIAAAALFTIGTTGCHYSTASTSWKSYDEFGTKANTNSAFAQQLAMGDSLGGSVWTQVVNERVAMARADFYRRNATASAPTD